MKWYSISADNVEPAKQKPGDLSKQPSVIELIDDEEELTKGIDDPEVIKKPAESAEAELSLS